jgi:hypothetical protein
MGDPLREVQSALEVPDRDAKLTRLFRDVLGWGPASGGSLPVPVPAPFPLRLVATPVAQFGGVAVWQVPWAGNELPTVEQRRAVAANLAAGGPEHLVGHVSRDGRWLALVWARRSGRHRLQTRALLQQAGGPVRVPAERLALLTGRDGPPPVVLAERLRSAFDAERLSRSFLAEYRAAFAEVEDGARHLREVGPRWRWVQHLLGRLLFSQFRQQCGPPLPNEDEDGGARAGLSPKALADVLALFRRYPFTAVEATSEDVEVALDPEALGTAYAESLPGRSERGAYYTPRPLVTFMCREALKCHLAGTVAGEAAVARFVDDGDPADLPGPGVVLDALRRVRVCDPACGCGAFLLGMLHELDRLRGLLDPGPAGRRRLAIVRANLNGLDLDPLAVDVARRRLWLSVAAAGATAPPPSELVRAVRAGDALAEGALPGGFDVVLTNPPYVRMELLKPLRPVLRRHYPQVHAERADLYVYFYARAQELLREGGIGCFLSSNKWLRAGYGERLRRHLLDGQAVRLVVDFGELPVFPAATFPAVVVWQKRPRGDTPTLWARVADLRACYEEGIREHVDRLAEVLPAAQFGRSGPRLLGATAADRHRRLEASGPCLGDLVGGRVCRGVVTGLNAAFLVDRRTRDRLLAEDPGSAAVLRPLLTGDDVRRYEAHFREVYLLYLAHGGDVRDYPALRRHLAPFRPRLERRASRQAWWQLQQPQAAYVPFFEAPKIVYPVIARAGRFAPDPKGHYLTDKVFFLPTADWYLLGVLNSRPALEYLQGTCSVLGDERRGGRLELREMYLRRLPIPDAPAAERRAVADLAREAGRLHGCRRGCVERFLRALGTGPAASGSRNPLERPWQLAAEDFRRRVPGAAEHVFTAARDETAALTDDIEGVERQIDERVAALYGVELAAIGVQ